MITINHLRQNKNFNLLSDKRKEIVYSLTIFGNMSIDEALKQCYLCELYYNCTNKIEFARWYAQSHNLFPFIKDNCIDWDLFSDCFEGQLIFNDLGNCVQKFSLVGTDCPIDLELKPIFDYPTH